MDETSENCRQNGGQGLVEEVANQRMKKREGIEARQGSGPFSRSIYFRDAMNKDIISNKAIQIVEVA